MCSAFLFATSLLAFANFSCCFFFWDSSYSFKLYFFLASSSKYFYALLVVTYLSFYFGKEKGLSMIVSNCFLELFLPFKLLLFPILDYEELILETRAVLVVGFLVTDLIWIGLGCRFESYLRWLW